MEYVQKITGYVLALVIGAILVGGLLIPTVEGITTTEKTFENEGYFKMSELTAETDTTLFWDHSAPYQITVGTEVISLSNVPNNQPVTVYGTDAMVLRFENRGDAGVVMQSFEDNTYLAVSTSAGVDMTLTISGFSLSGTFGTTETGTITSTKGFIIDPTGNYVMKNKNTPAYALTSDKIALSGVTLWGDVRAGIYGEGSAADGITVDDVYLYNVTTATMSDVTINDTAIPTYKNLVKITDCTFVIDTDGTDHDVTYSYFVVPASVTAELSQHLDVTEIAMFGVISLLGIIMLVVVAANAIRTKY